MSATIWEKYEAALEKIKSLERENAELRDALRQIKSGKVDAWQTASIALGEKSNER
jgi:cell shape-determining protein MreC